MAKGVQFKVRGFSQAILNMEGRKAKLANFEAFHKKAAIVVLGWIFKNFQKDGGLHDDSSLKWPGLKPSTIASRKQGQASFSNIATRTRGGPAILRDTGRLIGGFESRANRSEAVIKNKVNYSPTHEFGTNKIPQRKMFPMDDQAEDIVHPVMVAHIKKSIG